MANPYQEGKNWSIRFQVRGQDIYLSGFASEAQARKAEQSKRYEIQNRGQAKGAGPDKTTLAQALQDYMREKLPYLKGAYKEANRANRYLRAAGLDTFKLTAAPPGAASDGKPVLWKLELVSPRPRPIPSSLQSHRARQATCTSVTDTLRATLARSLIKNVRRYDLQELMTAMVSETRRGADGTLVHHYAAATIHQERALLRSFFNHISTVWYWRITEGNPAVGLKMPKIDNARERVLSNAEWTRLSAALSAYGNPFVGPALVLLLETAMRSSEPLARACWSEVCWERSVLRLADAKAGHRDVPLNPVAMQVLRDLHAQRDPASVDTRILPLSYEALKKAWSVACAQAGIENANIHDLRHTAATRYALALNGNMPVLKKITGHVTDSQLMRYINIKVDDVVRILHHQALLQDAAPAGMTAAELAAMGHVRIDPGFDPPPQDTSRRDVGALSNVVQVDFTRRRTA